MDKDIAFLLEQWARWCYVERGVQLGLPHQTPFRRLLGSTVPSACISDPLAQAIDQAVAEVCQRNEKIGRVLVPYFLQGRTTVQIAKKQGVSRPTVSKRLALGVSMVGEILER
ncbi:MAG: hypothetical protein CME40_03080 [Haliea sp.]|nr:hypothetical protein [Haliea sp.]|tara:strand:- start:172545 stop:172883 length:339 start_codon:yes stop_codon:yes gene_type:complete